MRVILCPAFSASARQRSREFVFVGRELLQRSLHAGDDPGNEPALFAEFQNSDIMLGITKQPSTTASIP
jgi:hypothetical protein